MVKMSSKKRADNCLAMMMAKLAVVQGGIYKTFERQCALRRMIRADLRDAYYPVCPKRRTLEPDVKSVDGGRAGDIKSRRDATGNGSIRNNNKHPIEKLVHLRRFALAQNQLTLMFYCYTLCKYLMIELIKLDLFSDYQYLDCYILGRFRFFGRTNKMSNHILLQLVFVYAIYRYVVGVIAPEKFKFYAIEFLFNDHADVSHKSIELKLNKRPNYWTETLWCDEAGKYNPTRDQQREHQGRLLDTNFYFRVPFNMATPVNQRAHQQNEWILRPNRTISSWRILSLYSKLMLYSTAFSVIAWICLVYYTLGGSVVTNTGFELAYGPACLTWIRRQQRQERLALDASGGGSRSMENNNLTLKSIYIPQEKLAHETSLDNMPASIPITYANLPQINVYQSIRLLVDILENNYWYIEFILYFAALFYLTSISSLDVIINARELKRRLIKIVDKMDEESQCCALSLGKDHQLVQLKDSPTIANDNNKSSRRHLPTAGRSTLEEYNNNLGLLSTISLYDQDNDKYGDEITKLQATLVDHFNLIRDYNTYLSFQLACLSFIWCLYTTVICIWMLAIKSRALEFEFTLVICGSMLIILLFCSVTAVARSYTRQLYPLIAKAMALDRQHATKRRWMTIIKFFYPKPLYCFTLFGTSEVSWMFCLKVDSWLVSAFVVLANFFYRGQLS